MEEQNVTQDIINDEIAPNNVENELKDKVEDILEKLRVQNMLIGARTMAATISNMIDIEINKPGKRTMADMKRIVKKVRDFCQKAIDHPVEEPKFDTNNEEETDA